MSGGQNTVKQNGGIGEKLVPFLVSIRPQAKVGKKCIWHETSRMQADTYGENKQIILSVEALGCISSF